MMRGIEKLTTRLRISHSELLEESMSDSNPEMRSTAARICRDSLAGIWKHVDSDNVLVKHISGGLSNWMYLVQLPEDTAPAHGEPRQVLLRFYGPMHGQKTVEGMITESVIFALLSERKLGPKLHGLFPGGRIEEYIPARPLLTKELADPELSALIAEKMAQIHRMQVPLNKEPTWMWDTMANWLSTAEDVLKNCEEVDAKQMDIVNQIRSMNLGKEIAWCRNLVSQQKHEIVFCHNDTQEGNILLRQNTRKRDVVLIDFEYSAYNYRGFDVANHFVEWQYDYTAPEYPFYYERQGAEPSDEQKLHFIRHYLRTIGKESAAEEEKLMDEVKVFTIISHLVWGLWSIVNARHSQIPFGYWDFADARLKAYQYLKEKMIVSGPVRCGVKRKDEHND
ncbi:choline/ethanolamine kinase isoform X2 [Fopius arisanus]|uniref:Choline/ethanolamine kinase isoform X2 n=1 Tax=Fopius arisanus TaxID=64838 RepID=A0A9R1TV92_9HYME|nr:PREDICTED: choline/ethanolamine kinase isoform X2 [Fopius arisanus]